MDQIEISESETESMKLEKSDALDKHRTVSDDEEFSMGSRDSESSNEKHEQVNQPAEEHPETNDEEQTHPPKNLNDTDQVDGVWKRYFLDLNELTPGSGFDDIPNSMKDKDLSKARPPEGKDCRFSPKEADLYASKLW